MRCLVILFHYLSCLSFPCLFRGCLVWKLWFGMPFHGWTCCARLCRIPLSLSHGYCLRIWILFKSILKWYFFESYGLIFLIFQFHGLTCLCFLCLFQRYHGWNLWFGMFSYIISWSDLSVVGIFFSFKSVMFQTYDLLWIAMLFRGLSLNYMS